MSRSHLSAAPVLQKQIGGRVAIGAHILDVRETFGKIFNDLAGHNGQDKQFDHLFDDGDTFQIGALHGCALHVPWLYAGLHGICDIFREAVALCCAGAAQS